MYCRLKALQQAVGNFTGDYLHALVEAYPAPQLLQCPQQLGGLNTLTLDDA